MAGLADRRRDSDDGDDDGADEVKSVEVRAQGLSSDARICVSFPSSEKLSFSSQMLATPLAEIAISGIFSLTFFFSLYD